MFDYNIAGTVALNHVSLQLSCRMSPREKEVACNKSAMHILHFYFLGQRLNDRIVYLIITCEIYVKKTYDVL